MEILKRLFYVLSVISIVTLMQDSALAGRFKFQEGNDGTQDVVGTISASNRQSINFTQDNRFVNDEARSVRIQSVAPGARLLVFDDPRGSTSDDWAEIVVKKSGPDVVVGTFQQTVDTEYYKITHHRRNNLDGKVSYIEVFPGNPSPPAALLEEIQQNLARKYSDWPAKRGQAFEYRSQDSEYRVWEPEISQTADKGYELSVKLDHIRGGALDDHTFIDMYFDKSAQILKADSKVVLANDKIFSNTLDVLEELPEEQRRNKYVAVATSAGKLAEAHIRRSSSGG